MSIDMKGEIRRKPHAPAHWTTQAGHYMVTAGTLLKLHHFPDRRSLDELKGLLLELADKYDWELDAWSVFSNHYHFVGKGLDPTNLSRFLGHLHTQSARFANKRDGTTGRQVWYQYWDTFLDSEKSYLVRLQYVMENPVRHGLVKRACDYEWCSTTSFLAHASRPLRETVMMLRTDEVRVADDYNPLVKE